MKANTYEVTIDGTAREATIRETDAGHEVTVGDRVFVLRLEDLPGENSVRVTNGFETHMARLVRGESGARLLLDGRAHELQLATAREILARKFAPKDGGKARRTIIKAPMPGLVVSVTTSEGSHVAAGDTVVVLEAMKMQNEFKSPTNGVVRTIHVSAGDSVAKDAPLVTIDPA
jgi:biotin carboxyl carrier protein